MKKWGLILLIFLLIPGASAIIEQGHIYLLAVKEAGNVYDGSIADLYLEIKPGSGRVFMETFPLSKLDTQISTRFAKEISCDYLDFDCDNYDFFYTIRSEASIVGGPSASAAIAVLTTAMLDGVEVREDIAITGTINSGGLIGPVGGLRAKVDAAAEKDIRKVLVPKGGRFVKALNLTFDLRDYAKKYGLEVIESADLTDALYYFTGKRFKEIKNELKISEDRKSTRLNSSHIPLSRMPSSA